MDELAPEREQIKAALDELQVDAWVYEQDSGAQSQSPQATYESALGDSDLYVGIFWTKLGERTFEEYELARRLGKDILLYEKRTLDPRPEKLQAFLSEVNDVTRGLTVHRFDTAEELSGAVKNDVAAWQASKIRSAQARSYEPAPVVASELPWLTALREKVQHFWLENVLERSLHAEARLDIPAEFQQDAVEHPWAQVLVLPGKPPRSRNAAVSELFEESGRFLLILGAPGGGKTTTLLELARSLLARSSRDAQQPVPIVLNLASWRGTSLRIWLCAELALRYQLPKRIAGDLLFGHRLTFLLDGLDEVPADRRGACALAINTFLETDCAPGLVVCCRLDEYLGLAPVRLRLGGAVRLEPLESSDVDAHLLKAGAALAGLRQAIQFDESLKELARTPLLLDVMRLTYRDRPAESLFCGPPRSLDATRTMLFIEYVNRMFERRTRAKSFDRDRILTQLSQIAVRLREHGDTVFQLETLQPTWLRGTRLWWPYLLVTRPLTATPLGFIWGDAFSVCFWTSTGLLVGLDDVRRFSRRSHAVDARHLFRVVRRFVGVGWLAAASVVISFLVFGFSAALVAVGNLKNFSEGLIMAAALGSMSVPTWWQQLWGNTPYVLAVPLFTLAVLVAVPAVLGLPYLARPSFWDWRIDVRPTETLVFNWRRFLGILATLTGLLWWFRPQSLPRGQHVQLINAETGATATTLATEADVSKIEFSPDGAKFWLNTNPSVLWRARDARLIGTSAQEPRFSKYGRYYVFDSPAGPSLWNSNDQRIAEIAQGAVSWSRDDQRVYVEDAQRYHSYDTATGKELCTLDVGPCQSDPSDAMAGSDTPSVCDLFRLRLSADEKYLFKVDGGTQQLWNLESCRLATASEIASQSAPAIETIGNKPQTDEHGTGPCVADSFATWSPDRATFVHDSFEDGAASLCEAASRRVLTHIPTDVRVIHDGHGSFSSAWREVRFAPDSTRVALRIADVDSALKGMLLDTHSGKVINSLGRAEHFEFSLDGRRLVTSGAHDLALWNARDGQLIRRFATNGGLAAFSPSGKQLVIAGTISNYSHIAQVVLGFGAIAAVLLSRRPRPRLQGARRGLHGLAARALGIGAAVGFVTFALSLVTVSSPSRLAQLFLVAFTVGAWFGGGMDLLNHYLLRAFLGGAGVLPWRVESFLDVTTELAFTRKVGNGYIFVHRLLLEHFAERR